METCNFEYSPSRDHVSWRPGTRKGAWLQALRWWFSEPWEGAHSSHAIALLVGGKPMPPNPNATARCDHRKFFLLAGSVPDALSFSQPASDFGELQARILLILRRHQILQRDHVQGSGKVTSNVKKFSCFAVAVVSHERGFAGLSDPKVGHDATNDRLVCALQVCYSDLIPGPLPANHRNQTLICPPFV
jgi:hypothetical protein